MRYRPPWRRLRRHRRQSRSLIGLLLMAGGTGLMLVALPVWLIAAAAGAAMCVSGWMMISG